MFDPSKPLDAKGIFVLWCFGTDFSKAGPFSAIGATAGCLSPRVPVQCYDLSRRLGFHGAGAKANVSHHGI